MLNIGGPELLIILLVALVVLGPERLPGAARQVGRTVNQLRSMAQGFQQELENAAKPELPSVGSGTDPEHIRTAAKTSGAALFAGTGVDSADAASTTAKPVSAGGPEVADESTHAPDQDVEEEE